MGLCPVHFRDGWESKSLASKGPINRDGVRHSRRKVSWCGVGKTDRIILVLKYSSPLMWKNSP